MTPTPDGDPTVNSPLSKPPLYDNGDIIKLSLGDYDPRIGRAEMPAVNRVSAALKNRGTILEDALSEGGLDLVQGGIGDCNAGYTLREVVMALAATGKLAGDAHTVTVLESLLQGTDMDATLDIPYGDVRGNAGLITGAKSFLDAILGFEVRDYVTVTHGGRASVFIALQAFKPFLMAMLQERGIEGQPLIAVPVETWGTYPNIIEQAFGPGCFYPIPCPGGLLTAEALDEACSRNPRIRMLVFCNPVNPSGLVYGSDRMANIARIVAKHQLAVHADDMYAMFAWKKPHRSLLRAAAALAYSGEEQVGQWVAGHTTMLTGVMKAGGSGTRVNFTVIPNPDMRGCYVAKQGDTYGPPNMLGQQLQLAFIQSGGPERVWNELHARRNKLEEVLGKVQAKLKGTPITLEWTEMEGGFYTSARFKGVEGMQYTDNSGRVRTLDSGENFAFALLELCGVIGSPDVAACIEDIPFIRLAYGTMSIEVIERMGENLVKGMAKLLVANGHRMLQLA